VGLVSGHSTGAWARRPDFWSQLESSFNIYEGMQFPMDELERRQMVTIDCCTNFFFGALFESQWCPLYHKWGRIKSMARDASSHRRRRASVWLWWAGLCLSLHDCCFSSSPVSWCTWQHSLLPWPQQTLNLNLPNLLQLEILITFLTDWTFSLQQHNTVVWSNSAPKSNKSKLGHEIASTTTQAVGQALCYLFLYFVSEKTAMYG